jgi:4-amino-4-deoxychorismate lyase
MVKVHSQTLTYESSPSLSRIDGSYPWPIVTLAWFLRYPNPYATHVLSTDTIYQSLNPATQVLKVVRLHLKRGKLPLWSKRFLSHISESWIVETTEVDLRSGRMETRMRNLDHKRVLYVEERGTWLQHGDKYPSLNLPLLS